MNNFLVRLLELTVTCAFFLYKLIYSKCMCGVYVQMRSVYLHGLGSRAVIGSNYASQSPPTLLRRGVYHEYSRLSMSEQRWK